MLRVGLTGGLGSGKSTVAQLLRGHGAEVIEADELGRAVMEPGHPAFAEIVRVFGRGVVGADGRLERAKLAEMAFRGGRLQELNAIVHPAVIEAQRHWTLKVFARDPAAVAVIVSALIFEVERDARDRGERDTVLSDWRRRMDRVVVVTAPDDLKIARYVARLGVPAERRAMAEVDARSRLGHQVPDALKAARADYVVENTGDLHALELQVTRLWQWLQEQSNIPVKDGSLK
jgi:dephospho-CoA kinase